MGSSRLKSGWTRVAFGDVVQRCTERSPDPEAAGVDRYVGLEHLDPGELAIRRWGAVGDGTTFTSIFRPGHVLFGKRRAYLRKVAVPDFSGVCSGDIYVLESRDKDYLLPQLLPFICQTDAFFKHAIGTSAGSLSPRTNWQNLAVYEFALPPLAEQCRIVAVLSAANAAMESSAKLRRSSAGIWTAWLASRTAASGYETYRLGDLLNCIEAGKSVAGYQEYPKNGELAVIKVSAVNPNEFRQNQSKILVNRSEFDARCRIHKGDFLMTRANTPDLIGECCLVDKDYSNLMLSDKTLRLIPCDGVSKIFLWGALQSPSVRQQIKTQATGTGRAMKNLSQAKIFDLQVPYPDGCRATAEAESFMATLRASCEAIDGHLDAAGAFRRQLSRHLLVGSGHAGSPAQQSRP